MQIVVRLHKIIGLSKRM